jgi:hypothetical protein
MSRISLHTNHMQYETHVNANGLTVASKILNQEITESAAITSGVPDEGLVRLGLPIGKLVNRKRTVNIGRLTSRPWCLVQRL